MSNPRIWYLVSEIRQTSRGPSPVTICTGTPPDEYERVKVIEKSAYDEQKILKDQWKTIAENEKKKYDKLIKDLKDGHWIGDILKELGELDED